MSHTGIAKGSAQATRRKIKCLVWDLDGTLWDGVLLEDRQVSMRPGVVDVIQQLDHRGILQSVASRNDPETALAALRRFSLDEFFLCPQIGWQAKSVSVRRIAAELNIGLNAVALIDDQPFERDEVRHAWPQVLCVPASEVSTLLRMPAFSPTIVTAESRKRRLAYRADTRRRRAEETFQGPKEAFLAALDMTFALEHARAEDLDRAEELTARTHQLNTTGYTYSREQLRTMLHSKNHSLIIASLRDIYGTYGKIGLAVLECSPGMWMIKLLLMSCRVASRGVGTVMIHHIVSRALSQNVRIEAEFRRTRRNRLMYVTYKLSGFREVEKHGSFVRFVYDRDRPPGCPPYVRLVEVN